jgi:hypothetical protein
LFGKDMSNNVAVIIRVLLNFVRDIVLGFAVCFGLILLLKWWELPTGAGLLGHHVKDAAQLAIPIALGITLGDFTRQLWPKRSKLNE